MSNTFLPGRKVASTKQMVTWRNALRDDRALRGKYDPRSVTAAKLVGSMLANRYPNIKVSIRTLTKDCGFGSVNTTRAALDLLHAEGWITWEELPKQQGRIYTLTNPFSLVIPITGEIKKGKGGRKPGSPKTGGSKVRGVSATDTPPTPDGAAGDAGGVSESALGCIRKSPVGVSEADTEEKKKGQEKEIVIPIAGNDLELAPHPPAPTPSSAGLVAGSQDWRADQGSACNRGASVPAVPTAGGTRDVPDLSHLTPEQQDELAREARYVAGDDDDDFLEFLTMLAKRRHTLVGVTSDLEEYRPPADDLLEALH